MKKLSDYYRIRSRYMRSVNLGRDGSDASSLKGYIPTRRSLELTQQVIRAARGDEPNKAWTLTGVYGTGKSACANFLAALFSPDRSAMRIAARRALSGDETGKALAALVRKSVPDEGFVRVLAVGQREPVEHTVVRALAVGVEAFWAHRRGRRPAVVQRVAAVNDQLARTGSVGDNDVATLVADTAKAAGTGVLVIVDELGKLLEHSAHTRGAADLYLLQQLAELSSSTDRQPVMVLGLLHQAFSDYGQLLSTSERAEWEKIAGRFRDVPFSESSPEMLRLVAEAIEQIGPRGLKAAVARYAREWVDHIASHIDELMVGEVMTADRIGAVYPLNPIAALVLPTLCSRFGQHDRSLFTFLASSEPQALAGFMEQHGADPKNLESLRLPQVYDYFLGLGGRSLVGRGGSSRWSEIHDHIRDAGGLDPDEVDALKVIGVLNLVATAGPLRASEGMVLSALVDRPNHADDAQRWRSALDRLRARKVVSYRRSVDEFRLWQGSDFDIDLAVAERIKSDRRGLAEILTGLSPLPPIVAQRHSYRTGTLRYFERQYRGADDSPQLRRLELEGGAGAVIYWLSDAADVGQVAKATGDGFPLMVVQVPPTPALEASARELSTLVDLERTEVALQADKVARREVRARIAAGRQVLESALDHALANATRRWIAGAPDKKTDRLNPAVSRLCDVAYYRGPEFWNELINRRELTSQGARAQRSLIEALLESHEQKNLGISGNGPEFSIYDSLLRSTGIHRLDGGRWVIRPPTSDSIAELWTAIESFCREATDHLRPVDELYRILEGPPFGVKRGVIPIMLAAVLVHHADDVSVYQDGSFLPVLASPHFELLVKNPARFAVKHFELAGIRWEVFRELESILRAGGAKTPTRVRNATLLTVVRPLVRFARELPLITRSAKTLGPEALGVRDALLSTREPDRLIFEALPTALGMQRLEADGDADSGIRDAFKTRLFAALRELQQHYEGVLEQCHRHLQDAFRVGSPELREDLRVRASYLTGRVIDRSLRSFVKAAADTAATDREWLEALLMVVADRPVDAWTDEDLLGFEVRLADLARRFLSLYALRAEGLSQAREGFEGRRVSITTADGRSSEDFVWVNLEDLGLVEREAVRFLEAITRSPGSPQLHRAILVAMLQRAIDPQREMGADDGRADAKAGSEKRHA